MSRKLRITGVRFLPDSRHPLASPYSAQAPVGAGDPRCSPACLTSRRRRSEWWQTGGLEQDRGNHVKKSEGDTSGANPEASSVGAAGWRARDAGRQRCPLRLRTGLADHSPRCAEAGRHRDAGGICDPHKPADTSDKLRPRPSASRQTSVMPTSRSERSTKPTSARCTFAASASCSCVSPRCSRSVRMWPPKARKRSRSLSSRRATHERSLPQETESTTYP